MLFMETISLVGNFLAVFIVVMGGLYAYNRHVLAPLIDHLELDTNTQLPNKKTFKHQVTQDYLSKDQKGMLVIFSIE